MSKAYNPVLKPVCELEHMTEMVPTVETWELFKNQNFYASISGGYLDSTYDMLEKIEKVIAIQNFDQMREELTKLYIDRYNFLSYALDHT